MNSPVAVPSEGALRLPDLSLIRVQGADAASFLHGQLSNDVLKIGPTQARWAAYCNAQGRMLASFTVAWRPDEAGLAGSLWLAGATDLHEAMLKRLRMFVLRAKAVLDAPGPQTCVLGLAGAAAARWVGEEAASMPPWQQRVRDGAAVVRLPDAPGCPRWLWIGEAAAAPAVLEALPALTAEAWAWWQVQAGVAPVVAATSAQFVPQMLNYEVIGGVDFRKGCYPGQEIVARSQYLGKLKRRAFVLESDQAVPSCAPGQEVYWSGDSGQPAGMVAAAAPQPNAGTAPALAVLAELKLAATETGTLHLGAPDGPRLIVGTLPYGVPAPEAAGRVG